MAEEGRGRAMANILSAPFEAGGSLASGYLRGREQGVQEADIKLASQAKRQALAEEQARKTFLESGAAPTTAQQKIWYSPVSQLEQQQRALALQEKQAALAASNAALNNQLVRSQIEDAATARRLTAGEAYAAGKLREAQGKQEAYNIAKASGSPFVLAGGLQAPRPMDIMDELKAKGYSEEDAYRIAGKILPEGGAAARTKQAIDDQTSGFADIMKKNQDYQAAIKSLEDSEKTYKAKTGMFAESAESQAALDKAILVLSQRPETASMAEQLKKGRWRRAGESMMPGSGETTMDLGRLMKQYVGSLKSEANNEIIARIEALPDYVKAQPHIQNTLAKLKAEVAVTEKPSIFGNQNMQPEMVNQGGVTKINMQRQTANPFNRYASPTGPK